MATVTTSATDTTSAATDRPHGQAPTDPPSPSPAPAPGDPPGTVPPAPPDPEPTPPWTTEPKAIVATPRRHGAA